MKTERATISLPGELMAAAQAHCESQYLKFSNYVEKLVRGDLKAAGKFSSDAASEDLDYVRELIAAHGASAVKAKLDELADGVAETSTAGGAS